MKKKILKIVFSLAASIVGFSSTAQTYTFTNCTATGQDGPTQAQINAEYSGGNTLTGNVTINTQGIQEWTVPTSGLYQIEVLGAAGGSSINYNKNGGSGTRMIGEFNLTAGSVLKILVGQEGPTVGCTPGGGGGSYVALLNNTALIIAGGGGGASSDYDGIDALLGTSGATNTASTALGGTAGNGGFTCLAGGSQHNAGGGGGFIGDGQSAPANNCGGVAFINGGRGGDFNVNGSPGGEGGFGGGGGSSYCTVGGGAGGGYSGGAGGEHYNNCGPNDNLRSAGGGGGSFNSGTNQTNTAGIGNGMGVVIITSLCNATTLATLTYPSDSTLNNDTTLCGAVVNYITPTGVDNCGNVIATQTAGLPSGSVFPIGVTTNTYTFTNAMGTVNCSFNVTVNDNEIPVINCPNDTVVNTDPGVCGAIVNYNMPIGSDNCPGATVALTSGLTSGSLFPVGVSTITFEATDAASNISTPCSFTVTVNNTQQVNILLNPYNSDTICHGNNTVPVPAASPAGGTYSGAGITGSTFTPNVAGPGAHYTVYSIVDANTCTNSDSVMIVVEHCTGIEVTDELSNISIYPNPTNGIVNINLGDDNNAINYSITTIEGRVVKQETNVTDNNLTVNLSNESKGIYLLKIESNSSSKVYKLVKR